MNQGALLPLLYDAGASGGWTAGMIEITRALLARFNLPQRGRLLEVGCGSGALLHAVQHEHPDLDATGLDLNPRALEMAAARDLRLLQATLLRLPFADATFDAVLALDALDQAAIPLGAALIEMRRVLRPGGLLFVRVSAYPWLYGAHDAAFNTGRRYSSPELADGLREAGLTPVRMTHANVLLAAPAIGVRLPGWLWERPHFGGLYATPLANCMIHAALRAESAWLRRWNLPAGLSLIAIARRDSGPKQEYKTRQESQTRQSVE